MLIAHMNL